MPSFIQSLNILVADTDDVRAGLQAAVAETLSRTADVDLAAAEPYSYTATLSAFVGPAVLAQVDAAVAETSAWPVAADVIIGPAGFASLDVRTAANGLILSADLDAGVAAANALTATLGVLAAEPRNLPAKLRVTVSGTESLDACLNCLVCDAVVPPKLRTVPLSLAIAENRNCPLVLRVAVGTARGFSTLLNLVVQTAERRQAALDVNVKSPDLRVGGTATYNPDGDEVEALLFVQDTDGLHPEWIESMTAQLLYRDEHDLGSVAFDCTHATADGDVQSVWMHPAHATDLVVRFTGVVNNCGDVTFDVPVGSGMATTTFSTPELDGVDAVPPRMEYAPSRARTQQLVPAPEELDVLDTDVVLTLLAVDFISDAEPLEVGTGPIDYSGGGNRLLPSLDNDGSFVLQPADTLPHSVGGYTTVEAAGQNLLTNSDFAVPTSATNPVPTGWQLDSSDTVTVIPSLVATGDINALQIRAFGSGPYVGPKSLTLSWPTTIPLLAGAPVTWSCLSRLSFTAAAAPDIPLSNVKVDTLRLTMSFRDAGDAELSQQVATFNPADITGESLVLLQNAVGVPPIGTVGVRVSLHLESIETSDNVYLYVMAPQVEAASSATSRIVGAATVSRAADVLRLPQAGNLEVNSGSMQVSFAASYAGTPAADACLLDTRTANQNGFALYHLNNGKLRFIVAGAVTDAVLETPVAYQFGIGAAHTVSVSWSPLLRSIWVDGTEAAASTDPVMLPEQLGTWIWLFQSAFGVERFDGILTAFEIEREPQD